MRFLASAIDPGDLTRAATLAAAGRLTLVDKDMEDVLPGIDLHLAPDTHSFASIWVRLRNDGRRESQDCWVLAGDLIYSFDNIGGLATGIDAGAPFHPIGIAVGSQENLLHASEAMLKAVAYERRRVVPVHEEALGPGLSDSRGGAGACHQRDLPRRWRGLDGALRPAYG